MTDVRRAVRAALLSAGYVAVPLARNALGHLEVAAVLNDRPATLLLDTGAARTVIARARAADFGVTVVESSETAGGLGTAAHAVATGVAESLAVGALHLRGVPVWAMDLAHVNEAIVARGGRAIDVILGADLLASHGAVLDFAGAELYLLPG